MHDHASVSYTHLDSKTEIRDYGAYSSVRNLTSEADISLDGDSVTVSAEAGTFYYQANLKDAQLPWNISGAYMLDGKNVAADELAGSNGHCVSRDVYKRQGNIPGSGALMTFRDSSWRMSIVVAAQPHFKAQDPDTTIFWGYGLYTDHVGDYVKKPMRDCTGAEILKELLHQLHWEEHQEEIMADVVNVIPCMMPYVDAQFQPRAMADRPPVVPQGSTNFAMVSQFVEIPEDMVFTEEYSVRAARIAVYTLFDIPKKICPVTPYNKAPKVLLNAARTMYR